MKKSFLIFLIFLGVFFSSFAQEFNGLNVENISNIQGLSHNNVTCIFQDSKGFLWIGTSSGLNRFDGKSFYVFKSDALNKKTISANRIYNICEDKNQNIWVATEYGLTQIIRETNECNRLFVDTLNNNALEKNLISNVFCDSEGNLWIKTRHNISRFNLKTGKITAYKLQLDFFNEEFDRCSYPIFQDSDGILWIGTNYGLGYFEPMNDDFIFFRVDERNPNSISNNKILSITEDSQHILWIGTQNGLNRFDKHSRKFQTYFYAPTTNSIVNGICEGILPNTLWLTTESNGLYLFDTQAHSFTHFGHTSQRQDISTNQTNCVLKSAENILWVGTQNGLNKIDIKQKRFQLIGKEYDALGVKYNYTTAIHIDNDLVFFGTKFGGLQIYDLTKNTKKTYSRDKGNFPTNYITSISPYSENEILIGGDGILLIYNTKNNSFTSIDSKIPELHSFCITKKRVKCILCDSRKNIWIGTNFGIIFYDNEKRTTKRFDSETLPSNLITCFYENYKNKIFIGCENGICYYDYKTDSFTPIDFSKKLTLGFHQHIFDITEDGNGDIWIGTNFGLVECSAPHYQTYRNFTTNEGLISNDIFSILTNDNEIWMGTNNGLASFIPDSNVCKTYSIHDGIQDYEFSQHSAFQASNGYMFFGGAQGINLFHPDSIHVNAKAPNLEFLGLEYIISDKRYSIQIKDNQKITLPWNISDIKISFAALEFTQPYKNQYKYMLSGQNEKWINLDNQNYINIIKLPIGTYDLKVMASNVDGIWSSEKIIHITIKPPIWRTTYAYIFGILLLVGIIYYTIRKIIQKLKRENRRLLERQVWADKLEKQQIELESKNKNILDSINYAKRIQSAILPARAKFRQLVPSYFMLYMPKDIVSGDFYWIRKIDTKIFIVCADCTGHGVPGAFMSIVGNNLLRNITKTKNIHKASEILDYLNKSIIELFTKNEIDDETAVKDGMDISICVFHTDTGVLEFSGALTRMLIVRNNQLLTYRGDKNPVGLCNEQDIKFTEAIIRVQKNDRFYLFSDGFADQFGGEKGKKMKFKHFKHIILSVQHLPLMKQGNELKKQFQQWQGKYEQVDDVLVMGFDFNVYLKDENE